MQNIASTKHGRNGSICRSALHVKRQWRSCGGTPLPASQSSTNYPAGDFGRTEYVELRNLVCSRLTLFNARRGGEPCRMVVTQWTNRKRWLADASIQLLTPSERQLFSEMELLYGTGKGNHLVSCMVPRDCISAMEHLVTPELRQVAGVLETNTFIFPNMASNQHCGGWDALATVCKKAGIGSGIVNATNQRARTSTVYACLDVPEQERSLFFSHTGHSAQVNAGTYQRSLGIQAVVKVGSQLLSIDRQEMTHQQSGSLFTTNEYLTLTNY